MSAERLVILVMSTISLAGCKRKECTGHEHKWERYEGMQRIAAGTVFVEGDSKCVDEFWIDEYPVGQQAFEHWSGILEPRDPEHRGDVPENVELTSSPRAATRYCASRGLDLPTDLELLRAARGSSATFEWGEAAARDPNCNPWAGKRTYCPYATKQDVIFLLDRHRGGEWVRTRPVVSWIDVANLGVPDLEAHMFRCVKRPVEEE